MYVLLWGFFVCDAYIYIHTHAGIWASARAGGRGASGDRAPRGSRGCGRAQAYVRRNYKSLGKTQKQQGKQPSSQKIYLVYAFLYVYVHVKLYEFVFTIIFLGASIICILFPIMSILSPCSCEASYVLLRHSWLYKQLAQPFAVKRYDRRSAGRAADPL